MLLRQVQARPLQGHHLRALRRRGHAAEGAPRAHGPHRPRRSGLAHLVLQGRSEPHRLPARHRPARAREGPVLRRVDRDAVDARSGRRTSPTSRTRSPARASASTSIATRRSRRSTIGCHAGATTSRPARRRTSTRTTTSGPAGCRTGPRRNVLPPLEEIARSAVACSSSSRRRSRRRTRGGSANSFGRRRPVRIAGWRLARSSRSPRPRPDRGCARASARDLAKATGSKKGAITKHLKKIQEELLSGESCPRTTPRSSRTSSGRTSRSAREVGAGLLGDVLATVDPDVDAADVRELAYDLCLVEGARRRTSTRSASGH